MRGILFLIAAAVTACAGPVERSSADYSDSSPPNASALETAAASPPLNRLEAKIATALNELGLDAQRVEHSFSGAFMWAQIDGGSALFVSAYPIGIDQGEFAVLSEREIEGLTVQRVEYSSGPVRDRFICGDATYEVEGRGFRDFDELLGRLVGALGCSETRSS